MKKTLLIAITLGSIYGTTTYGETSDSKPEETGETSDYKT